MKNELLSPDILTSQLELRYQELKRCLEVKLKNQKESPQGKLRISLSGGQRLPQYYHIMDAKDFNGSYIPHSQMQKIKQLAQKDYDSMLGSLQFHQLKCTCGHSACLSVHGYAVAEFFINEFATFHEVDTPAASPATT